MRALLTILVATNKCRYVSEILKTTSSAVEQVEIEPDGKWSIVAPSDKLSRPDGTHSSSDDDDLIEIQDSSRTGALKAEAPGMTSSILRTPPFSSREASINSNTVRSSGAKRTHSSVIDLTLSSDDEQPSRDPKRLSVVPSSRGFPSSSSVSGIMGESQISHRNATDMIKSKSPNTRLHGLEYGFGR